MKLTKRQLKRIIKEEKRKILREASAFEEVGGDQPVFHSAPLDEALNNYVEEFVFRLEDQIGESPGTLILLETLKQYLVDAITQAGHEAMSDAGVRQ